MTLKELKDKSLEERKKLFSELCEERFRLQIKRTSGQLEKNHRLGEVRRQMARIKTLEKIGSEERS